MGAMGDAGGAWQLGIAGCAARGKGPFPFPGEERSRSPGWTAVPVPAELLCPAQPGSEGDLGMHQRLQQ